jgi:tetratricopeptide (TPR) repeat protein
MRDIVDKRIENCEEIKIRIQDSRRRDKSAKEVVADAISRAMKHVLHSTSEENPIENYEAALNIINSTLQRVPNNGDLLSMLGRCHFLCGVNNFSAAEDAFRSALEHGCSRAEMFDFWILTRKERKDWLGIVDIANRAREMTGKLKYVSIISAAHISNGDDYEQSQLWKEAIICYEKAAKAAIDITRDDYWNSYYDGIRSNLSLAMAKWIKVTEVERGNFEGDRKIFNAIFVAVTRYMQFDAQLYSIAVEALERAMKDLQGDRRFHVKKAEKLVRDLSKLQAMIRHVKLKAPSIDGLTIMSNAYVALSRQIGFIQGGIRYRGQTP